MAVGNAEPPVEETGSPSEPEEISVVHARRKLVITKTEIQFLKLLLSVVSPRAVPVAPVWPCASEHYLKAQDLVDYIVSSFIARQPNSQLAQRGKNEDAEWDDADDRLVMKLLSHQTFGSLARCEWTNSDKEVRKIERKSCTGRISKTHEWLMSHDRTTLAVPAIVQVAYGTAMGMASGWEGRVHLPWQRAAGGGGGSGSDAQRSSARGKGKAVMPKAVNFVRFADDPQRPDCVVIGIQSWNSNCKAMLKIPPESFGLAVKLCVQNKLPSEKWRSAVVLGGPNTLVHHSGEFDESPLIPLPRPLAREGLKSYLEVIDPSEYESLDVPEATYEDHFTNEELVERGDVDEPCSGYLEITIHLQPVRKPDSSKPPKKRKQEEFFAPSPRAAAPR